MAVNTDEAAYRTYVPAVQPGSLTGHEPVTCGLGMGFWSQSDLSFPLEVRAYSSGLTRSSLTSNTESDPQHFISGLWWEKNCFNFSSRNVNEVNNISLFNLICAPL